MLNSTVSRLKVISKLLQYIEDNELFSAADRILVAVSGGPDSTALAHMLKKAGFNIAIAHFNFKLRGKDSDLDQQFVKDLAQKLNVQFFTTSANTRQFAQDNKLSIEMAARQLRYKWFEQLAEEHQFTKIATAHTADDNVETILLNLARGTGIRGIVGIPEKNGKIVRPLLFAFKKEILEYCKAHNLDFRIDHTNFETEFTRNKIRHLIIPEFEKINPSFKKNVLRTAANLHQIWQIADEEILRLKQEITTEQGNVISVDINKLRTNKHSKIILFEILRNYDFSPEQIAEIHQSLDKQTGTKFLSKNYIAVLDRGKLIISKKVTFIHNKLIINNLNKRLYQFNDKKFQFRILKKNEIKLKVPPNTGQFDAEKISLPLTIRFWKFGDWFIPLGMQGKRKLSDFLKDQKLNLIEKQSVCVLEDGKGRIVWVMGYRIDNRFKITDKTETVLQITILD